jgi:hypothetical protein
MLNSIEGVYRDGKIELFETPPNMPGGKVIVTFLDAESIDLKSRGIDENQAANLRERLRTFADDWDRPEMDVYDAI